MDECQRCPSEIVELANDVMAIYDEPLKDVRGAGGQIHQVDFGTPDDEHSRIGREIVRVYRERPSARHLVLVTRRQWGYGLRDAIRNIDSTLTAQTVFSEDILETWPVREAFIFLSIVAEPDDAATLRDWISYREPDDEGKGWKAPKRNAAAYARLRASQGVLDFDEATAIAQLEAKDLTGAGRVNVLLRLQRLQALLADLPDGDEPRALIEHILSPDVWITDRCALPDLAREDLARLRREAQRILEVASGTPTLVDVVRALRSRIATREPLGQDGDPDIKIVTLWGAKGLTADFVYVVGLCDEAVPGPYDGQATGLTKHDHELEQLRLLYVTLTRAKSALVLSRPTKIKRGHVAALGLTRHTDGSIYWQTLRHCRFFADVPSGHLPQSADGSSWSGIDLDLIPT
jgi:superfamily I DNA/RNA helicase